MGRRGWAHGLGLAALVAGCGVTDPGIRATDATPIAVPPDADIQPDPDVRILTLDNGLTVYLRSNDRPGASAEMRLVVNAGSGQEDPDQSATAHFLEHMLFNGTSQFPGNELIDTLRGFGMQFGADVNAYTSYDETVYELTVPTDTPANIGANLRTGLDVLREWLTAATLDAAQVDKEKGVVLDEWRQSQQTFAGRVATATEATFVGGSGYEGHSPSGTDAAINSMTPELLRRFYDNWYRPDNAAIMVVGDFDVDEVETEVRDRFESLTARGDSPPRIDPQLPEYGAPTATVITDPDATTGDVEVTLPRPYVVDDTVASLRSGTLISLAYDMIATRLNDDISRGEASYTSAFINNNGFVRWLDAPSIAVTGEAANVSASLDAVIVEFERALRFGFDPGELDRSLRAFRSTAQDEFDGSDTVQDADYISRYVDHFLVGTPIPDADSAFQIFGSLYDEITPQAVASAFNDLLAGAALHVMVVAPDSAEVPTEDAVLARLAALPTLDLSPRVANATAITELMSPPDAVDETASEQLPGDDAFVDPTMLTFANGARVVINPTSIADNDIYFAAASPGGLSLVDEADVPEALNAVSVVTSSGVGELDAVALDTLLADGGIELYPSIDQTSEGFTGAAVTGDLELLFQLVNQYMVRPRFDQVALDAAISSLQSYVDDPDADPDLAEFIAYSEARYGAEPRFRVIPTADELTGLDLETIERVWRDRFGDAGDWVFAISGDFDVDQVADLARRYVGTLPGTGATEAFKDYQPDPPTTIVTKDVQAGTGDKGSLTFDWNAPVGERSTESVYADALTSILNIRLTDHIREELGASYSPTAFVGVSLEPDELVESYLNVTGDPSKIAETSQVVIDDVKALRSSGPTETEFDAAIAELTETYSQFDNQTISQLLVQAPRSPQLIDQFRDRPIVLEAITVESMKTFIERVLPIDRYIEIRTVPA